MIGIVMGPMAPVPLKVRAVVGPPRLISMAGREIAISPRVMGPTLRACVSPVLRTLMSAVYLGMVKPWTVSVPKVALMGMSMGIETPALTGIAVSGREIV